MTNQELRQLRRRARQARDPQRYVIQDDLGLFYNAGLDEWALRPEAATLFRQRKTAAAVRSAISVPGERMRVHRVIWLPIGRVRLPPGTNPLL